MAKLRKVKRKSGYQKRKHLNDDYLVFIRKLPCAVCGTTVTVAAAHVGMRGMSNICPNLEAIPLCFAHHDRGMPESHHKLGKLFWAHHNIDRYELIRKYNDLWMMES